MPFETNKIDPEYQGEHAAVRLLGGKSTLFDYDLFNIGDLDGAFKNMPVLSDIEEWVYRGWMMSPEKYELFYSEMKKRGYLLTNGTDAYAMCHVYPIIYSYIKERAVRTYYTKGITIDHNALVEFFGKGKVYVKDWIKSTKGTPGSTVINDITDKDEVERVTHLCHEHRGDLFYGGFVFKEFVDIIKRNDGNDEEYRAFFIDGKMVTWNAAHGNGGAGFKPPTWINTLADKVPAGFFTLDFVFVEGEDGPEAFVLEAGDGGVSGLSVDELPITLYSAIDQHELIK